MSEDGLVCKGGLSRAMQRLTSPGTASAKDDVADRGLE